MRMRMLPSTHVRACAHTHTQQIALFSTSSLLNTSRQYGSVVRRSNGYPARAINGAYANMAAKVWRVMQEAPPPQRWEFPVSYLHTF